MNRENIKTRNEEILSDYVAGMPVEAISEKYQLSKYQCYSILRRQDYRKYRHTAAKRRSPLSDRNQQIIEEYRNGASGAELTKKYNLTRARIYKILCDSDGYISHRVSGVLSLRREKTIERNKKMWRMRKHIQMFRLQRLLSNTIFLQAVFTLFFAVTKIPKTITPKNKHGRLSQGKSKIPEF